MISFSYMNCNRLDPGCATINWLVCCSAAKTCFQRVWRELLDEPWITWMCNNRCFLCFVAVQNPDTGLEKWICAVLAQKWRLSIPDEWKGAVTYISIVTVWKSCLKSASKSRTPAASYTQRSPTQRKMVLSATRCNLKAARAWSQRGKKVRKDSTFSFVQQEDKIFWIYYVYYSLVTSFGATVCAVGIPSSVPWRTLHYI